MAAPQNLTRVRLSTDTQRRRKQERRQMTIGTLLVLFIVILYCIGSFATYHIPG